MRPTYTLLREYTFTKRQPKNNMKILFIIPPYLKETPVDTQEKSRSFLIYPYGVLSLGTYLKKYSNTVIKIIDLNMEVDLKKELKAFKPDMVGISIMFDNSYSHISGIAETIKAFNNDTLVLVGGAAATASYRTKYSFNFTWLGRPIIQIPQDMVKIQELIWEYNPDFIIETGIAHGGSIIFNASILKLLGHGKLIAIDIDIRKFNRDAIESHPVFDRIELIEGSSISQGAFEKVKAIVGSSRRVMIILDSCHTHYHVLQELTLYTPFISKGGMCIVMDTGIEDLPLDIIGDRPWGKGNSPKSAVTAFMRDNNRFVHDKDIETQLLITSAPGGYLRCVRD